MTSDGRYYYIFLLHWLYINNNLFIFSPSLLLSGVNLLIKLLTQTESFFTSIYHVRLPAFFSSLAAPASADSDMFFRMCARCLPPIAILTKIDYWHAPPSLPWIVRHMLFLALVIRAPATNDKRKVGRQTRTLDPWSGKLLRWPLDHTTSSPEKKLIFLNQLTTANRLRRASGDVHPPIGYIFTLA